MNFLVPFLYKVRYSYIATTLRLYTYILIAFVCGSMPIRTAAQQWKVLSSSDFNYYYEGDIEKEIDITAINTLLKKELTSLQKRLNYHTNGPINVFLVDGIIPDYLKDEYYSKLSDGGDILLFRQRVVLMLNQSPERLVRAFSRTVSALLIDEMMYGGTFQDKIKSANLINLPPWLMPGLHSYLSEGWSVEMDNALRIVHDQYGLSDFNAIPYRYDEVKGASFWKYIEFKYGKNAISTVLYMARLTRKFNATMYYSFQLSVNDIFIDWQEYYNQAYSVDQRKPNPVGGILISPDRIIDIAVLNEDTYYSLEKTFSGVSLFINKIQSGKRNRLYSLSQSEQELGDFRGSVFVIDKGVGLVSNTQNGVKYCKFSAGEVSEELLPMPYASAAKYRDGVLFLATSRFDHSQIWIWENREIRKVKSVEGYVNSFDISDQGIGVCVSSADNNSLYLLTSFGAIDTLYRSESRMRQFIFADDSTVLLNSESNGIWNGKLFSIKKRKLENVTNYRSNILMHQYNKDLFVEYLEIGKMSSLYITSHLKTSEFFIYDTIQCSYFLNSVLENKTIDEPKTYRVDSLEDYFFQSPVRPSTDFTLSNYDSLHKISRVGEELVSKGRYATGLFDASKSNISIVNRYSQGDVSGFSEGYSLLLPSRLNIHAGVVFSNQYHNKAIGFGYTGLVQSGARDIELGYYWQNSSKYKLEFVHRKRTSFSESKRVRYFSNYMSLSREKKVAKTVFLEHKVGVMHHKNLSLYLSEESFGLPFQNRWISSHESVLKCNKVMPSSFLNFSFKISPLLDMNDFGWSVSSHAAVKYSHTVNPIVSLMGKAQMGTSQGTKPVFYLLGGSANDLLNTDRDRAFSDYSEAMFFQNIFGVRGFHSNYRNGNTYGSITLEANFSVIDLVVHRPVASEVFSNFKVVPFFDYGTSFYGNGIYSSSNVLNVTQITSSTGAIIVDNHAFKNPKIWSFGMGVSTQIYGYAVRLDYALGYEDGSFQPGVIHLGLGSM